MLELAYIKVWINDKHLLNIMINETDLGVTNITVKTLKLTAVTTYCNFYGVYGLRWDSDRQSGPGVLYYFDKKILFSTSLSVLLSAGNKEDSRVDRASCIHCVEDKCDIQRCLPSPRVPDLLTLSKRTTICNNVHQLDSSADGIAR